MSGILNQLEDSWRILNRITGEISPGNGPLGRTGPASNVEDTRKEHERILDDISAAADFIRERLSP